MLQPLGNKLLIKQKVKDETTSSGIIIASEGIKKLPMGQVISVGEKVETVKVGDQVLFEGWNGDPVSEELGGEKDLMIISVDRITAKIV